jgi:hypothetical protein
MERLPRKWSSIGGSDTRANREAGMLLCWLSSSASTIELQGRRSAESSFCDVGGSFNRPSHSVPECEKIHNRCWRTSRHGYSRLNHEGCFVHI